MSKDAVIQICWGCKTPMHKVDHPDKDVRLWKCPRCGHELNTSEDAGCFRIVKVSGKEDGLSQRECKR